MRNNEAFSVGYDTLNRIAVAGTADNGSAEQTRPGSHTWLQPSGLGGDGGAQVVDNRDPGVTLRYAMGNTFGAGLQDIERRSFDHTNHLTKTETIMLAAPETPDKPGSALTVGDDASHAGIFALNNLRGEGSRMMVAGDAVCTRAAMAAPPQGIPSPTPPARRTPQCGQSPTAPCRTGYPCPMWPMLA